MNGVNESDSFKAPCKLPALVLFKNDPETNLWRRLSEVPDITMYGPTPQQCPERASLCSFNIEGCHPNDLATLVDQEHGVAMRAGHHCTQPLHRELGVTFSARLSAYFYNTEEEIDAAVAAVKDAVDLVKGFAS